MEKMIIALQEAIAHQGEDISRMSDELYTQQKEIAALKIQIAALKSKLQESDEASNLRPFDQETPPPHY